MKSGPSCTDTNLNTKAHEMSLKIQVAANSIFAGLAKPDRAIGDPRPILEAMGGRTWGDPPVK